MKRIAEPTLILIIVFVTALGVLSLTSAGDSPEGDIGGEPIQADLVIEDGTTKHLKDETIVMNGNILVEGTLILENANILMNSSYNGEFGIHVLPSGHLIIEQESTIRAARDAKYTFQVSSNDGDEGGLDVSDSTISGVGYLSTHDEKCGIFIESSRVSIEQTTLKDSYHGLIFNNVHETVIIRDSTFIGNGIAIILDHTSDFTIQGNVFDENERAITVSRSSGLAVLHNSFTENVYALRIDNTTDFSIVDNSFEGNELYGITGEHSHGGTIEKNDISGTRSSDPARLGSAITLRSSSEIKVTANSLGFNDIGIMLIHNTSGIEVIDNSIQGGDLGLYLYNEHLHNIFTDITITDTKEAAVNVRHSSGQLFQHLTFNSNRGNELNITASDIKLSFPVFDELDFFVDETSRVGLQSRFRVKAQERSGILLPESDVRVVNDGHVIYSTPGYGGSDLLTDGMGMTDWIDFEYFVIHDQETNPSKVEIDVTWKGMEASKTLAGELQEIETISLKIPDLTLDDSDISFRPSEPEEYKTSFLGLTLTNIGSSTITTTVSTYRVPGSWTIDQNVPVHEIELPFNAEPIARTDVKVNKKEMKDVDIEWTAGPAGDYTIVAIIDEDSEVPEVRENNNIASAHVTIKPVEPAEPEHAAMVLEIPENLDGATIRSSTITLTPTLRNEGEIPGTIILQGSITSEEETSVFYEQIIMVSPGRSVPLEIEVDLVPGDLTIAFTLVQQVGEDAVDIITPYLSFILQVEEGPNFNNGGTDDPVIPEVIMYSAVAGLISFILAIIAFAESARYRFLLFLVPLYMRMSKKDITEHYTRGEILGYVKQNPGESYNNIKRDLEMSNGKLAYHLSVLEKGGFLKSVTDGMYRRYYPKKMKVSTYGRITSVQEELLRRIEETPGITQKDLSNIVNLSTATINYHIRKLKEKEILTTKRTGIFIHYYLATDLTVEEIMANAISSSRRG